MIQSINPATGEVLKEFKEGTREDVLSAVQKAKVAQVAWAKKPKSERTAVMRRLIGVIKKRKAELLKLLQEEAGCPPAETEPVIDDIIAGVSHYCDKYETLSNLDFPMDPSLESTAEIQYVPHGVIGHIGIWNYPFWQTMITAIPALLAGNAVVFKPSEYVAMAGLKTAEIIYEAGVPEEVYQVVLGGKEIGREIVSSEVDAVVFTGGIETGRDVVKRAGVKPLVLELSGNDAAIICADCDLDNTIRGVAFGTFLHSGQVCTRIKRVYVVEGIADKFIEGLVDYSKKFKIGKEIFPMIRDEARQRVHGVVEDAVAKGAKLLLGGKIPDQQGFYYPATILKIEDDDLEVIKKETFGPVCSIRVVESEDEAIKLANDTSYGLAGSVWSKDYAKAKKIAGRLETGTVWINDSNLFLTCGEYIQGWKCSSIASSQERLMLFLKKRGVVSYNSDKPREWWY